MVVGAILGGLAGPFISAVLLAIRRGGRPLARHIRTWRSP